MNLALMKKILDHIDTHPNAHYQGDWARKPDLGIPHDPYVCDTQACIAGWAVLLSGYKLDWVENYWEEGEVRADLTADGESIEYVAEQLLGLSFDDAEYLFYPDRTLDEIQQFYRNELALTLDNELEGL